MAVPFLNNVNINGDIILKGDTAVQFDAGALKLKLGDIDGGGAITFIDFIVDGTEAMQIEDSTEIFIASKIGHIGDQDTYFEFPSLDTIRFTTGAQERIRINSAGNTGIGTASPSTKLSVQSSNVNGIELEQDLLSATNSSRLFFSNNAVSSYSMHLNNGELTWSSGAVINAYGGSERMRLDTLGNLGVGTTNPQEKIHASGSVARIEVEATTANTAAFKFTSTAGSYGWYVAGTDQAALFNYNTASNIMTLDASGNTEVTGTMEATKYINQKMYLNWHGYHSSTSLFTVYATGMTTAYPYAYASIVPPYNGYLTKVNLKNNPYASYTTGPTGTSVTLYVYKNGTLLTSDTQTYITSTPGLLVTFDFGTNAIYTAGDNLELRVQSNGLWRYVNWGIEITER